MKLLQTICYDRQELGIPELAKKLGITPQGLRYRIKNNLPLGEEKIRYITYRERLKAFDKWAKKFNHSELADTQKVLHDWLVEKASREVAIEYRRKAHLKNV